MEIIGHHDDHKRPEVTSDNSPDQQLGDANIDSSIIVKLSQSAHIVYLMSCFRTSSFPIAVYCTAFEFQTCQAHSLVTGAFPFLSTEKE